jgi:hypothetical protein
MGSGDLSERSSILTTLPQSPVGFASRATRRVGFVLSGRYRLPWLRFAQRAAIGFVFSGRYRLPWVRFAREVTLASSEKSAFASRGPGATASPNPCGICLGPRARAQRTRGTRKPGSTAGSVRDLGSFGEMTWDRRAQYSPSKKPLASRAALTSSWVRLCWSYHS